MPPVLGGYWSLARVATGGVDVRGDGTSASTAMSAARDSMGSWRRILFGSASAEGDEVTPEGAGESWDAGRRFVCWDLRGGVNAKIGGGKGVTA
jgi:hypothetical protein